MRHQCSFEQMRRKTNEPASQDDDEKNSFRIDDLLQALTVCSAVQGEAGYRDHPGSCSTDSKLLSTRGGGSFDRYEERAHFHTVLSRLSAETNFFLLPFWPLAILIANEHLPSSEMGSFLNLLSLRQSKFSVRLCGTSNNSPSVRVYCAR